MPARLRPPFHAALPCSLPRLLGAEAGKTGTRAGPGPSRSPYGTHHPGRETAEETRYCKTTLRIKTTSGQNCEAEEGKKTEEEGSKDGEDLPCARHPLPDEGCSCTDI
ncbi:uncharacterized protein AAG666_002298 isoform 2-T2 [Megaptera novaeangliae]